MGRNSRLRLQVAATASRARSLIERPSARSHRRRARLAPRGYTVAAMMGLFKKRELKPAGPFLVARIPFEEDGAPLPDAITALRRRQALIRETLAEGEEPLIVYWTTFEDLVVVTPERMLEVGKRTIAKELRGADLADLRVGLGRDEGRKIGLVSVDTHASLRGGNDSKTLRQSIQVITTPRTAQVFEEKVRPLLAQ